MTFEDWTDVMYDTMAVHPLSWIYYVSFIFLTAFVFLNMMIGVILEVMTAEHNADAAQQAHAERNDMAEQLRKIEQQLAEVQALLLKQNRPD